MLDEMDIGDDEELEIETETGFLQSLSIEVDPNGFKFLELYIDNAGPIDTRVPIERDQAVEFYRSFGEAMRDIGWLTAEEGGGG